MIGKCDWCKEQAELNHVHSGDESGESDYICDRCKTGERMMWQEIVEADNAANGDECMYCGIVCCECEWDDEDSDIWENDDVG